MEEVTDLKGSSTSWKTGVADKSCSEMLPHNRQQKCHLVCQAEEGQGTHSQQHKNEETTQNLEDTLHSETQTLTKKSKNA